jgi:hypothetical protein
MPLFRKRPVTITADRWFKNGDHPFDYANPRTGIVKGEVASIPAAVAREQGWEGEVVRFYRRPDVPGHTLCKHCGMQMHDHGWIDTLEGGHIVCPGAWVITGVKGERYPCAHDIFEATYEAVT